MTYSIYYTFTKDEDGIDYNDYDYKVIDSFDDIKEYEFENTYNVKYNYLSWYLEEGAKDLVKELENKWLKNELDVHHYYSMDFKFKDWLKEHYKEDALTECLSKFTPNDNYDYYKLVGEFNE